MIAAGIKDKISKSRTAIKSIVNPKIIAANNGRGVTSVISS